MKKGNKWEPMFNAKAEVWSVIQHFSFAMCTRAGINPDEDFFIISCPKCEKRKGAYITQGTKNVIANFNFDGFETTCRMCGTVISPLWKIEKTGKERTKKVYCKDCGFYKFIPSSIGMEFGPYIPADVQCRCPATMKQKTSAITLWKIYGDPRKINKNNDCKYFTPKPPSKWQRFKNWLSGQKDTKIEKIKR